MVAQGGKSFITFFFGKKTVCCSFGAFSATEIYLESKEVFFHKLN
jgi:hypothetical protein